MNRKIKVLTIFGTRPEAIKMAPLVLALRADSDIDCKVCLTGQHREMLDQVMKVFGITADYDMNIMHQNQTLSDITAAVIKGTEEVIAKEHPDIVLVHGDTSTSFAAALGAFYQRTKVGHVEAGLRTYDKYSPFPEEMNRSLTARIADVHFAPTENNRNNLLKENIDAGKIFVTGNTVIDALLTVVDKPFIFEDEVLSGIDFEQKRVIAVTCHRRENLGDNMANIFSALADIAKEFEDVEIVYPVHLNPKVREEADYYLQGISNVRLIEPLSYQPFSNLMAKSYLIVTDSGGIQEEGPALAKPVIVVRKETERPEAVFAGTVCLAGVEKNEVYESIKKLLVDKAAYDKMAKAVNPYGDGHACERIVNIIKQLEYEE